MQVSAIEYVRTSFVLKTATTKMLQIPSTDSSVTDNSKGELVTVIHEGRDEPLLKIPVVFEIVAPE